MKNTLRFLIFILVASSFGCHKGMVEMLEEIPPANPSAVFNYLALGDSYTIGQSVNEQERFPIQLANQLMSDSVQIDSAYIIAKTGWRTDQLISAIEDANLEDNFDLVSLLIGVNNQFQNRPIVEYEQEFAQLLNRAIVLAGGYKSKVFVLSIPDYGFTPFGRSAQERISPEIDQYNEINRRITENLGISYFNITPISRNGLDQPELVASDGLHPSSKMYRQWIALFYEEVKRKFM